MDNSQENKNVDKSKAPTSELSNRLNRLKRNFSENKNTDNNDSVKDNLANSDLISTKKTEIGRKSDLFDIEPNKIEKQTYKKQDNDVNELERKKNVKEDNKKNPRSKNKTNKELAKELLEQLPSNIRKNFLTDHDTICKGEEKIIQYYIDKKYKSADEYEQEKMLLIKKYARNVSNISRTFTYECKFDESKIRKKLKISPVEKIMLFVDTSVFCNKSAGFVITDRGIYWSEILNGTSSFLFKEINSIVHMNNSSDDYLIVMRHGSMVASYIRFSELKMKPLYELLEYLKVVSAFVN